MPAPTPENRGLRGRRLVVPEASPPMPIFLTEEQRSVVSWRGGPLLVIGGPGSGKTSVLLRAAAEQVRNGAPVESVLLLTFSRRSAVALRQELTDQIDRTISTPLVMTVHGLCLALLRKFGHEWAYGDGLHLLSGPEQDLRVRELLDGSAGGPWPKDLQAAMRTRAFAAEVRTSLARTRQWGMDPEDLVAAGQTHRRPEWARLGTFFDEYLDVLDAEQVMDYAELVHRVRLIVGEPAVAETLHRQFQAIYIDEYQEFDPAQAALVHALATPTTTVVATGDPDQSVFGFRGSAGRGILDFADHFRDREGAPAAILPLTTDFRNPTSIMAATSALARRLPLPRAVSPEVVAALRNRTPKPEAVRGKVEVSLSPTIGAEAEHIATTLRLAHLEDGRAWSEMAILVRSGRRSIPRIVRALVAAGVPVEVAGDEIPLASELAVRPLLLALQIAAGGVRPDRDQAARLLASPLGGLDSMELRRLGRTLREAERIELAGSGLARPSDELLRAILADPEMLQDCPETPPVRKARHLAELLHRVSRLIVGQASASEALWALWSATPWPVRLREQSLANGPQAERANRDLDAVCALFALAARSEEEAGHRAVRTFVAEVEGQQIPGDTLAADPLRGGAVQVLTAHRAKGQQWPLVVVASVQEGLWPDVRQRDTLLGLDQLTDHAVVASEPVAVRVAEERRLFYVACTRASEQLLVTAIHGTEGEGDQASRFLAELGVPVKESVHRQGNHVNLASLVAELRRVTVDAGESLALRRAAAARLAQLAEESDEAGHPLVRPADPATWWGMSLPSQAPDPDEPERLVISGSQLGTILECPRRWFLQRKVKADRPRGAAASFGSVVHVLIQHATESHRDVQEMAEELDHVWDQINFDAVWLSGQERVAAETALRRFAHWQQRRPDHEVVGVEVPFQVGIAVGHHTVEITGTIDRLERDSLGRYLVIDFKTGRSRPRAVDVITNPQLGLYQLAVTSGGVAGIPAGVAMAGGSLVHLRHDEPRSVDLALSHYQPSLTEQPWPLGRTDSEAESEATEPELLTDPSLRVDAHPTWVHDQLAQAVAIMTSGEYPAVVSESCRYCPVASSCPTQLAGRQVVA